MKIVLSIFIIIGLVVGGTFWYTFNQLGKVNTTKIIKTDEELGIKPDVVPPKDASQVTNIAFFGLDKRSKGETGRSDSIMILSIDEKHKKIKISSLMRDTYVEIKGHGKTKLNHAYAYGGPQLAIRTLNENFNLDIRDYVTVDFSSLEKLINAIGGVTIDIEQDEVGLVPRITKSGPQTLNGMQALAYSRIRHTSGDDFRRTKRQRLLVEVMFKKIKSLGATKFPSLVSKLLPYTETSINRMDIIKMGTKVLTSKMTTLEQKRFPMDGYWKGQIIDKVWYLVADMKATIKQLHKFIYE